MRKLLNLLCCVPLLLGAAPSRTQTYTAGQVINPAHVTENEDNIYSYLQAGVDTIRANAVVTGNITDGTIVNADLSSSAAIAYSKLTLTDSITASDLAATLTFSDGDLLNLASVNTSSTAEGLRLPQATSCASGTAEGQVCWDTDDDRLVIGDGSAAIVREPVKMWAHFSDSGLGDSFNVTSIANNATGDNTITIATDFANDTYPCAGMTNAGSYISLSAQTAGTVQVVTRTDAGVAATQGSNMVLCAGDQ